MLHQHRHIHEDHHIHKNHQIFQNRQISQNCQICKKNQTKFKTTIIELKDVNDTTDVTLACDDKSSQGNPLGP